MAVKVWRCDSIGSCRRRCLNGDAMICLWMAPGVYRSGRRQFSRWSAVIGRACGGNAHDAAEDSVFRFVQCHEYGKGNSRMIMLRALVCIAYACSALQVVTASCRCELWLQAVAASCGCKLWLQAVAASCGSKPWLIQSRFYKPYS